MQHKYQEIYRELKEEIESGVHPYQSLLPSEHQYIQRFQCSRNTVRRALAMLGSEGYIQAVHGKGVRVIFQPTDPTIFRVDGIQSFQESARRNGKQARTQVLRLEQLTVDAALATRSGFAPGTPVWCLERLRYLDALPLILDCSYFHATYIPYLDHEIASTSVYAYLESELELHIATAKRTLTVERCTAHDREHLAIRDYNCVAVITGRTYDALGEQFEFTQSRHRPDYFAFHDIATRNPGESA